MAWPDVATIGANPQAAAEFSADDAGAYELLPAAFEHPRFLRLWASPTAAANPPASGPAVDAAGRTAAANLPTAGPTAAAGISADGSGVDDHLHADVQHPTFLPTRRIAPCSGGYPRKS